MNANPMPLHGPAQSRFNAPCDRLDCQPAQRRGIVLIADDNLDAANSLAMLIELMGRDAYLAHDGLEAVELAQRLRPDLIFMDLTMPCLNGVEATLRIRRECWGRGMRICALTALGDPRTRARIRAAGFDHFLLKPASYAQIDALLPAYPRTRSAATIACD